MNLKCSGCGLLNVATDTACRRCGMSTLAPASYGRPGSVTPMPAREQMAAPSAPADHRCDGCNRDVPTKNLVFMQNIGVIVLRFSKTVSGQLCRTCVDERFWSMTLITLFFGWWGVLSFFYTVIALPMNVISYVRSRTLPRSPARLL
jgi:hypothetical protein